MEKLEMWDFIAMGTLLLCAWMAMYGLKMCRDANKEGYNDKSLRNKIGGAAAASALYLIIRFLG